MKLFKTLLLCAGIGLAVLIPATSAKVEVKPMSEAEKQTIKGSGKYCGQWFVGCGPNPEPCVTHDPDPDDPSQKYWTSYVYVGYYACKDSPLPGSCSNGNTYFCAEEYKWVNSFYEFKCGSNGYAGQKTGMVRYARGCP